MQINGEFLFHVGDIVKRMYPNSVFEITNDRFTKWYDADGNTAPSWEDIMKVYDEEKQYWETKKYQRDRKLVYPTVESQLGDLFDIIWHAVDEDKLPGKYSEWYKEIKQIKERFPK